MKVLFSGTSKPPAMKLGKPSHSDLLIEVKGPLFNNPEKIGYTFQNEFAYKSEGKMLNMWWEINVLYENKPSIIIAGYSQVEVISTSDYESDLPHATYFIVESSEVFLQKVKSRFVTAPTFEPKFNEISSRLLEYLTEEGLY